MLINFYICLMKVSTKEKIIKKAIDLFNKKGFAAVSLFELAKSLEMTRGNFTYHYKTKDDLLVAIVNDMWQRILIERNKTRQLPSFENLHNEVQLHYKFQKKYAFLFLDTHVLNHSILKPKIKEMTSQTFKDAEMAIAFAIANGNMRPEPFKGIYHNIVFKTWMLSFFWYAQQKILGENAYKDGEKLIWSMLVPHFTKKGITAFESYFGKRYLNSLGKTFETKVDQFISF